MNKNHKSMPNELPSTVATPAGRASTQGRPRGRRPPGSEARTEILDAARHEFAALGYRGASLRRIATRAAVDVHLIAHYFGSKQKLFLATVDLPFEPDIVLEQLHAAGQPGLGHRLAQFVGSLWAEPDGQETMTALLRSASTEEQTAALIRETVNERLLLPLVLRCGVDHPELRASLIASQIVGLATATHILRLEPLNRSPTELLADSLVPVFEHYLSGELDRPK